MEEAQQLLRTEDVKCIDIQCLGTNSKLLSITGMGWVELLLLYKMGDVNLILLSIWAQRINYCNWWKRSHCMPSRLHGTLLSKAKHCCMSTQLYGSMLYQLKKKYHMSSKLHRSMLYSKKTTAYNDNDNSKTSIRPKPSKSKPLPTILKPAELLPKADVSGIPTSLIANPSLQHLRVKIWEMVRPQAYPTHYKAFP